MKLIAKYFLLEDILVLHLGKYSILCMKGIGLNDITLPTMLKFLGYNLKEDTLSLPCLFM